MQDLSSPTRDGTQAPCSGRAALTTGPRRKSLVTALLRWPKEQVTTTPKSKHEPSASWEPQARLISSQRLLRPLLQSWAGTHGAAAAASPGGGPGARRCSPPLGGWGGGRRCSPAHDRRDPSPCKSAQGSPQGRQARGPGAVNVPSQATGPWQGMTLQRLCRDRTWLPHAGVTTRVLSGGTQSEEPGQKEGSRSQGRITQAGCEGAPASREDVRPPSAFKPLGYGPWLQPPRETHTDVNQKVKCFCEFYQVQRKITHRGFAVFVSSLDSLCQVLTTRCSSFILTFA